MKDEAIHVRHFWWDGFYRFCVAWVNRGCREYLPTPASHCRLVRLARAHPGLILFDSVDLTEALSGEGAGCDARHSRR